MSDKNSGRGGLLNKDIGRGGLSDKSGTGWKSEHLVVQVFLRGLTGWPPWLRDSIRDVRRCVIRRCEMRECV